MSPARAKRSKVWLYFTKKDDAGICNTCKKALSAKGGNTTNMLKHLAGQHGIKLKECTVFEALRRQDSVATADDPIGSQNQAAGSQSAAAGTAEAPCPTVAPAPIFSEAGRKMPEEKVQEIHRQLTRLVVKRLLPFCLVEDPEFRKYSALLNPKYSTPSRECISSTFVPAWYEVEKSNMVAELKEVSKAAITADGWTSFNQDHYITVTLHYIKNGQCREKVLKTQAVYESQTGITVAREIANILQEFGVRGKVVAATVDNASNMDVAIRELAIIKLPYFAHSLNLGAQKLYNCNLISNWAARIREVDVWMRKHHLGKVVLKEKQKLLKLPQHMLILDCRTRWNSLFLMMERFCDQFPAIQAAAIDPRIRGPMERDKLARMGNDDLRRAEDFVHLMRKHYASTLAVSSEKKPTCGQILPILQKLEVHYTVKEDDSPFVKTAKWSIWNNLSQRYQAPDLVAFLEEATALDPRFKSKLRENSEAIWDRIRAAAAENSEPEADPVELPEDQGQGETLDGDEDPPFVFEEGEEREEEVDEEDEVVDAPPPAVKRKKTALEELFEEEDSELLSLQGTVPTVSIAERVEQEVQLYRSLPCIPTKNDAALWWWEKRDTLPLLSGLAATYLCVQASSTPSERVFSTAGDTLSPERSSLLADKADQLIFLKKNG